MKIRLKHIAMAFVASAMFAACSGKPEWKVNGEIEGAEGKLLTLEASNNGHWYPLDTVTLKANGKFSFKAPAAGYPDIYRLTVNGNSIYFPIDSIETVTVKSPSVNLSEGTISGTPDTETFMRVNKIIDDAVKSKGAEVVNDENFKRTLAEIILEDPAGIPAYYIINKTVSGKPIFSPASRSDLRVIGAVANAMTTHRPDDPRTAYITNLFLANRPASEIAPVDTIVASELQLIDIDLLDPKGKHVKLSDVAGKGKVVVLSFTSLTAEQAPTLTVELDKIYEANRDRLEIYQVGVDPDEFAWRQAARNIPWISVYCGTENALPLANYNISNIPTTFIIDRNGALAERVINIGDLRSALNKYM